MKTMTLDQVCDKIGDAVFSGDIDDRDFSGFIVVFAEVNGLSLGDLFPCLSDLQGAFEGAWKSIDHHKRLLKEGKEWE